MQKKKKKKKDILYEADGANCHSHTVVLNLWMINLLTIKSKKCAVSKTKLQFHCVTCVRQQHHSNKMLYFVLYQLGEHNKVKIKICGIFGQHTS